MKNVKLGMDQAYLNVTPVDEKRVIQDIFNVYGVSDNCFKVHIFPFANVMQPSVCESKHFPCLVSTSEVSISSQIPVYEQPRFCYGHKMAISSSCKCK